MASRTLIKKNEALFPVPRSEKNKSITDDEYFKKHLGLALSNTSGKYRPKEINPSSSSAYERDMELCDLSGGMESDEATFPPFPTPSSLALYFKSVSKYPLLNEDQEKGLACRIKHCEEEFNQLALKWCVLFRETYAALFPRKQRKEIMALLRKEHTFISLFEELELLLKERGKLKSSEHITHDRGAMDSERRDVLDRIEAEISKCIAKMRIGERELNNFMHDIESLPYNRSVFKKRKKVELEMRKTLRDGERVISEIKDIKNQMVNANLRLVISIAKKYLNQGVAMADLIQEGNLGLMRAIDTYDHLRGHRLVTYATWWIKQAMIRAIDCQSKTVRTPVYVNEKLAQIIKASKRLYQEWEREPTLAEIAEETKTPLESLERALKSSKDYVPLEYMVEDQTEAVVDAAEDFREGSIPAQVAADQLSQVIHTLILADLTERERDIIKLRFGIGDVHDHTLEEIGRTFNLSRERIRQILEAALRKMRTPEQLVLLREFANPN